MVTPPPTKQEPASFGTAKRLRRNVENIPDGVMIIQNTVVMATVVCSECGERFAVAHRPALQDLSLAEQQGVWLKDRFVWDHIQEHKHSGSIRLPGWRELKLGPDHHC